MGSEEAKEAPAQPVAASLDKKSPTNKRELPMFNLSFMAGAVYRLEITGTSMIKKTNGFSKLAPSVLVVCAYGLCYFALTRAMSTIRSASPTRCGAVLASSASRFAQ